MSLLSRSINSMGTVCLLMLLFFHHSSAHAEEKIGLAISIRNDVTGKLSASTVVINDGEDVYGKEIVKTGANSAAKLVFKDSTNLSIGPSASVTLDKFVFAGADDYKKAAFTLVKGGFRFVTGHSDKRAYEIRTPLSVLSVRGTIVDIFSQPTKTIYSFQDGKGQICRLVDDAHKSDDATKKCIFLNAGQSAIVTASTIALLRVSSGNSWNFSSTCADNPSLCEVTQMAEATGAAAPASAALSKIAALSSLNQTYVLAGLAATGAATGGIVAATHSTPVNNAESLALAAAQLQSISH